jgi:hypothetical protein
MSTTITIPSQLVPHVRAAATHDLGQAGGDILGQSERPSPELQEPLERFDTMRAVLDALPSDPNTVAYVEAVYFRPAVEALREHARFLWGIMETARREGHADMAAQHKAELDTLEAGLSDLLSDKDSGLLERGA